MKVCVDNIHMHGSVYKGVSGHCCLSLLAEKPPPAITPSERYMYM